MKPPREFFNSRSVHSFEESSLTLVGTDSTDCGSGHRRLVDTLIESKKLGGSDHRSLVKTDSQVIDQQFTYC